MAEYIDKSKAISYLNDIRYTYAPMRDDFVFAQKKYDAFTEAIEAIDSLPAADVNLVIQGEWLTGNDNPRSYGRIRAMCGRCGQFALYDIINVGIYKEQLSNFCPYCGADMREPPKED